MKPRRPQTTADDRKTAPARPRGQNRRRARAGDSGAPVRADDHKGRCPLRRDGADAAPWLAEDAFKGAYEAARRSTFQAAISRIPALTVRAVTTLDDLLGPTKPRAVRLGAARTVAEIGMHQYDAETILKKLDDLENRQPRR
jgi:hypothetical protein